jgi:hypothetical protein
MKGYVYAVVDQTPDYMSCELLTQDRDEAEKAARGYPQNRTVYEIDLGELVLSLIRTGVAKEL